MRRPLPNKALILTVLVKKMPEAGYIITQGTKVSYFLPTSDV